MPFAYSNLSHPLRVPLAAEIHSRPSLNLDAPESISYFAVYGDSGIAPGQSNAVTQSLLLAAFCAHFGVAAPVLEAKYFHCDFGRFRLKWECHTEFATYTFAQHHEKPLPIPEAFEQVPMHHIPQQWLMSLQGKIMVAAHIVIDRTGGAADSSAQDLQGIFEGSTMVGSRVVQGGELWTDFLMQSDGFSRFVIRDVGLRGRQAGRLVQRVLEIETYRMMALLGLPHAQQAAPILNSLESELVTLTATMVETDAASIGRLNEPDTDDEQKLLDHITRLAARAEKLSLDNSYRFAASQAYFRLVHARIEELREERMEGFPTVEEFMDRRLTPAMRTCEAMASRQEALAQRIANTNDLLRTRVGVAQELQNRKILQSMNARAGHQLRLQQAVEGLSVVAISYYLIGLFSYLGKAAEAMGWVKNSGIGVGLLIPVVAAAVWIGLRQVHKKIRIRPE